jgi:FkbM family methyltransferase
LSKAFFVTNIRASLLKRLNAVRHHGPISLVKLENCRFLLDRGNRRDLKNMAAMNWERARRDRAVNEIKARNLDLFVDVGANLGLYVIDINSRVPDIETLAFEPQPDSYNQLCGNIFANGFSDMVRAERVALSDREGTAEMVIDSDCNIHSSLGETTAEASKFDKRIMVPLVRFDDRYPYENRRVFMKMDVEGHELPALRGMRDFLARNKVSMQIESGAPGLPAIAAMLTELGYRHNGTIAADHFFSNF